METKEETAPTLFDTAKLLLAALILVASIVAYYYFASQPAIVRVAGVLAAFGIALWVAFQSIQGQELWRFIQGSRVELRKVVWPTRQETMQTTVVVLVFALIMGVFFWLLDLSLLWFTTFVTGQRS